MHRQLVLVLPFFAVLALVLSAGQCFPRQCRSYTNCQRQCECTDGQRNEIVPCALNFRCDVETGYCADEYNQSCEEICQKYAAKSACGTKTCTNEAECVRQLSCSALNQQTGQVLCTYNCDVPFVCETDPGVCEDGFGLDEATICAQFCPPPAGCGG